MAALCHHVRREAVFLEQVVALFQFGPEGEPLRFLVALHVRCRHFEREDVDGDGVVGFQALLGQQVNFLDAGIGHGEAPFGFAAAMDHELVARAVMLAVEFVRVADIHGEVVLRAGPEAVFGYVIKPFGRLQVAAFLLGSERGVLRAYFISAEGNVELLGVVADPDFEQAFLFEHTDIHGRGGFKIGGGELGFQLGQFLRADEIQPGEVIGHPGAGGEQRDTGKQGEKILHSSRLNRGF